MLLPVLHGLQALSEAAAYCRHESCVLEERDTYKKRGLPALYNLIGNLGLRLPSPPITQKSPHPKCERSALFQKGDFNVSKIEIFQKYAQRFVCLCLQTVILS